MTHSHLPVPEQSRPRRCRPTTRAVLTITAFAALSLATPLAASAAPTTAPTLSGYVQKTSPIVAVPAGSRVQQEVTCPRPAKVIGGGALVDGNSLDVAIQYSAPTSDGTRWVARVSNLSTSASSFHVYAVCATGVKRYSYVEGVGNFNPPGTQGYSDAFCPTGTVPLGGGGNALSPTPSSSLDDSMPLSIGWRATASNPGTDDDFVVAYVVCGVRPAGWRQVAGTATTLKPASQGQAAVTCPPATKVLSGGGRSSTTSALVALNSSLPTSTRTWQIFQNNSADETTDLTAYATCATVSA